MDTETKDILMSLLEKMENMDKKMSGMDNHLKEIKMENRSIKLSVENDIKPTLQAVLENQTEVINQKSHITVVENKQEELKDRVDVIEYAVKENLKDIEELKKRA